MCCGFIKFEPAHLCQQTEVKMIKHSFLFVLISVLFLFAARDAFAQKGCKSAMSTVQFAQYKSAIKSESFTENQMNVAKAGGKCLSCSQIKEIMNTFSFEASKLDFAKWAYSQCVDKSNYYTLNSAFSFSSSKSELNSYVAGQGAIEEVADVEDEPTPKPLPTPQPKVKTKDGKVRRETGWNPYQTADEDTKKGMDAYNEAFKKAQKQMDAFFVMTIGGDEGLIDGDEDVIKPQSDEASLPAKAPRIVILTPELSSENKFSARTNQKLYKVSGVISSTVGIYEVFVNETEAVLNSKGEFSSDVLLALGDNTISIKAKDTKGQIAKIGFQFIRESAAEPAKIDPVKPDPKPISEAEFISSVDKDIPNLNNINKDGIAVVIGNSKYSRAKPVDFAVNDARSMKQYLINVLGYKEGNILYYENATLGDLNTIFGTQANPKGRLYNTIKQGVSDVVIFYSGHGAPGLKDNKAYFVPVEADPNYMENSGYSLDILYDNLKKLPAKSIVFFSDACFSGANVFDKISPMVIRSKEPAKEGMVNTTLLSSCKGTEVSCWHNEEKHGLFTFYLLQAMKDYLVTDKNKDKQISVEEVYSYIADNNEGVPYYARRQYGLTQTPVLQGLKTKILFKY